MFGDNRNVVEFKASMLNDNEQLVLQTGFISQLGALMYFRPNRGSNGFGMWATQSKMEVYSKSGEKPRRARLLLEFY